MKILLSYKYSELDKRPEWGIEIIDGENYEIYVRWIWWYLGKANISVYPYSVGSIVKEYKYCNDAKKQAQYIINRINKTLNPQIPDTQHTKI